MMIKKIRLKKNTAYWILQASGWLLYAVFMMFFVYINRNLYAKDVATISLSTSYYLFSSHIFRNIITKNKWLDLPIFPLLARVILSNFILGISNYVAQILIYFSLDTLNVNEDFDPSSVITYSFSSMVFYLVWSLFYFGFHYFDRYNKSLKYQATIKEFELNRLKSQLNPHFIFNALNSIRALVDEDPIKSKHAITQLATILRSSLIMNKSKLIPFSEELKVVNDYLGLESIRYEERLKVVIDIEPGSEHFLIPPLMLQTLVENGIKHGISKLKEGGEIKINTQIIHNNHLLIQIRNSGQLINHKTLAGFGLENTKQRLELIFDDKAKFKILNENQNTVLTEISIPK